MKIVKKRSRGKIQFPMFFVYLFAFIEGALMYPTLMYYMQSLGMILFLEILVGTMIIFGTLAFIGQNQKSGSFIGLGKILFIALTVMVIVSILNVFLRIDTLSMIISAAGIFIFSAYILVDVNQFKTAYEYGYIQDKSDYSIYVLNVYLDIINLLFDILDFDKVDISNLNRQIIAFRSTIGRDKVEVLKERILILMENFLLQKV